MKRLVLPASVLIILLTVNMLLAIPVVVLGSDNDATRCTEYDSFLETPLPYSPTRSPTPKATVRSRRTRPTAEVSSTPTLEPTPVLEAKFGMIEHKSRKPKCRMPRWRNLKRE